MNAVHRLRNKVRSITGTLRRHSFLGELLAASLLIASAMLLVGLLNYLFKVEDRGLRIISTLCLVAAVGYALLRLRRARWRRFTDIAVARRLEQTLPPMSDRLSSAVAFLHQDEADPLAGSPELRRHVVLKAAAETEQTSFRGATDRRQLLRNAALTVLLAAIVVLPLLSNHAAARIAVRRLLNPFDDAAWPRNHYLVFRSAPTRLAKGHPFVVEVIDQRAKLPAQAWLHYRTQRDGEWVEERQPMLRLDDAFVARREAVTEAFEYRVSGGDDNAMAWRRLEVVFPPQLRSVEIVLHPPSYTGYPSRTSGRHLRVLEGTRIQASGEASRELLSARLLQQGETPIDAAVERGNHFSLGEGVWVARKSTTYQWELTDRAGLSGTEAQQYSLNVEPDTPPSVAIEVPEEDLFVTADATVVLEVLAKDNLAVRDVYLQYSRSDQTEVGQQHVLLYQGTTEPTVVNTDESPLRAPGEVQRIRYQWSLATLQLAPGSFLNVHAVAADYRPKVGQTAVPRRINIVQADELEDRISQRQDSILAELERALRAEREVRDQTVGLRIQVEDSGRFPEGEAGRVRALELHQHQIHEQLLNTRDGVLGSVISIQSDLSRNRLDSPDTSRRMQELADELRRLGAGPLPAIEAALTDAKKSALAATENDQLALQALERAVTAEEEVIQSLETLVGEFAEWAGYRRFAREAAQLRADQQQLQQATREEIGLDSLNVSPEQLPLARQTSLRQGSQRQATLARRLDALVQRMQAAAAELQEQDPLGAETLSDAVHQVHTSSLSSRMRDASEHVARNQIGQALTKQTEIDAALQELVDILRDRREQELGRLAAKLRDAERDLDALRQRVAGLRDKVTGLSEQPSTPSDVVAQARNLSGEILRMSRRLRRLTAEAASRSANSAALHLQSPADRSGGATGDDQRIDAPQVQSAEQELDEAQRQLAEARRQAEADLAQQQLAQFDAAVAALVDGQSRVIDETQRIDGLRDDRQSLGFAQLRSLAEVAEQQRFLRDESTRHADRLLGMGVIQNVLRRAAEDMNRSADLLADQRTDSQTIGVQQAALQRLQQLLAALEIGDAAAGGNQQQSPGGQGGGQGDREQQQNTLALAQLKLLKAMQLNLFQRTRAVEERMEAAEKPDSDDLAELDRIAVEQQQLTDLLLQLKAGAGDTATEPDAGSELPDLDKALQESLDAEETGDLPALPLEGF